MTSSSQSASPRKTDLKRHLVLMRPGFEETLRDEYAARFGADGSVVCRAGVAFPETTSLPPVTETVFARQMLPRAFHVPGSDDQVVAKFICDRIDVMTKRGNRQKGVWTLHGFAIDDDAGLARAHKIRKLVMAHVRARLPDFMKRYIAVDEFSASPRDPSDVLLQIYAPSARDVWFSIGTTSDGVSLFEGGFQRMKTLRGAPSRSASKLEEALAFLGRHPAPGDTAVDLGAAPGGWSYVLARHGAHVQAVDHARLGIKDKTGLKGRIEHVNSNGLTYMPEAPVDWMVCDMVMGARETLSVLESWIQRNAMGSFVVNIKLPKTNPWPQVATALGILSKAGLGHFRARHLLHDRSEITLMGTFVKK